MHVALIADEKCLEREHAMLNRLSIGLIDEGAQLTRLVPQTVEDDGRELEERQIALANRVAVPMRLLPGMRKWRAQRLAQAIQRAIPDVLYAVGEQAWSIAIDLAEVIDRPVVLDFWSLDQAQRAPRGRHAHRVTNYIAPTESISAALKRVIDPASVSIVPFGVAIPGQTRTVLDTPAPAAPGIPGAAGVPGTAEVPGAPIALAVVGSGRDLRAYVDLLGGLAPLLRDYPQVQVFLELRGSQEHEIWREAQRRGVLDRVSAIANASRHRPLLTRCDAMILPERLGEVRSLPLEAMAAGMPILASADPVREMLRPEETAVVVPEPSVRAWTEALRRLVDEPKVLRAIGLAGRVYVMARHRSSDQSKRLLRCLEQAVARAGRRAA